MSLQCKSATRASAALAIHYADTHSKLFNVFVLLLHLMHLAPAFAVMNAEQVHAWAGEHGLKYPGHDGLKQWVGDCADSRVKLTQELRAHYEPQKIIFRQLFDRTSCTYTYLLACPTTLEGVLIDPVDTLVERDTAIIREMGIKLKYGLNTHVHADHITGTGLLKQQFTGMQSVLSKASGGQADKHVEPGEKITFGSLFLEVRATPGHTAGCVTYVLGEEQGMAFTGDALLIRGCGRTDFQGGSADTLYDSVHSQIFTLPEECLLYPGHDYRGRMTSTVYEEKQFNPRLSHGKEKFLHIMDTLGLPNPKMLDVAVPANLVCGLHEVHDPVATESKA